MTTFTHAKEVKAQRTHVCDFCCSKIQQGELYVYSSHLGEDGPFSWKRHKHCEKLAIELKMYDDPEGVGADDFMEHVCEYYYDTFRELFEDDDSRKYDIVFQQLKYVPIREKIWHVIRHLNKKAKESEQ